MANVRTNYYDAHLLTTHYLGYLFERILYLLLSVSHFQIDTQSHSPMFSALNKLSELQQRIIAAIIGASLIISCVWWNEWSYFTIFFLICMLTQLEFYKLVDLDGNQTLKYFGTMNGMIIYTLAFLVQKYNTETKYFYLVFVFLSFAYFIKLYHFVRRDLKPFMNIAFTFLGVLYVAVPFALLHSVVFIDGAYTWHILLGTIFIIWASDTGAYFSGRKFGKRKLFFSVSPKKTWEGSLGGAALAVAVAVGFSFYSPELSLWQWVSISVVTVIAGTYGDLVESLFKRSIRIKDSGNTIPGHGGFLDRFDSLLLAAPFIAAFVNLLR